MMKGTCAFGVALVVCVLVPLHVTRACAQSVADEAAAESESAIREQRGEPSRTQSSRPQAGGIALRSLALSRDQLDKLLARYANEPSVERVVEAALRGRPGNEHFASMRSRARWRGLVPDLDLGVRRGQGVDLRSATTSDVTGVRLSTDDDLVLEATLRFELGRSLFADEEVAIAREARADQSERDDLVAEVVRLYYLRRRMQLERDVLGHSDIEHDLGIAEIEALLHTFTKGAFQRMMKP